MEPPPIALVPPYLSVHTPSPAARTPQTDGRRLVAAETFGHQPVDCFVNVAVVFVVDAVIFSGRDVRLFCQLDARRICGCDAKLAGDVRRFHLLVQPRS